MGEAALGRDYTMSLTFAQTMPPLVIVFSQRPQRRQVIMPYDARRRRIEATPPPTTKWGIVRVWAKVTAQAIAGDMARAIAGAIWSAVKPPPAYQFGGAL